MSHDVPPKIRELVDAAGLDERVCPLCARTWFSREKHLADAPCPACAPERYGLPTTRAFTRVVIDDDDVCDGCGPLGRGLFGICIYPGANGRGLVLCTTCLHLGIDVVDHGTTVRVPSAQARVADFLALINKGAPF